MFLISMGFIDCHICLYILFSKIGSILKYFSIYKNNYTWLKLKTLKSYKILKKNLILINKYF